MGAGLGCIERDEKDGARSCCVPRPSAPSARSSWPPFVPIANLSNLDSECASEEAVMRHTLALGPRPGLLAYMLLDDKAKAGIPGVGNANAGGASAGTGRRPRAMHIPPNTLEGVPIDTDCFQGNSLLMIRAEEPDSPHEHHFKGRRRNWELRVQGRFKRTLSGELFVGIVLRDFNYNQPVASHSRAIQKAGMKLVKYDMYLSWGDREKAAELPDAELSHLVTSVTGWDQVIITPPGKPVPFLKQKLEDLDERHGRNLQRNRMPLKEYSKAVDDVFHNLDLESTYTMCFWGVSQVIDLASWNFNFPLGVFSMARFFEDCPIHITFYELDGSKLNNDDGRHLESRKNYIMDLMFWSSTVRCPSLPSRYVFLDAPLDLERAAARVAGASWVEVCSRAATKIEGIRSSADIGFPGTGLSPTDPVKARTRKSRAWSVLMAALRPCRCVTGDQRGPPASAALAPARELPPPPQLPPVPSSYKQ